MCTCLTCTSRGACRGWFVFMSARNRPSRALGRETCTSKRGLISTLLYKSDLSSGLIDSTLLAYLYTARVYTQGVLGDRCLVHCSAKWASHAGSARAVCEKMRLQAHPIVHRRSVHARCAGRPMLGTLLRLMAPPRRKCPSSVRENAAPGSSNCTQTQCTCKVRRCR